MPVEIRISVNNELFETIRVARVSKLGLSEDDVNEYVVIQQNEDAVVGDWDKSEIKFQHRYGDDLVTLALEALASHQMNRAGKTISDPAISDLKLPRDDTNSKKVCGIGKGFDRCRRPYGHGKHYVQVN